MLSIEVAEYYGVKDAALCADFVTFVNGMMGFAEANRRECWGQLCLGMINIQTKLKALQSSHSELEAKHEALSQKFDETSEQYKKSIAISERLNASNRDFKTQIEYLKSQLPPVGTAKIGMTDASKQLLQIESANTQPTTAVRSDGPKAKRSIPDFVPESEDDQPPPAKRDKSEIIIELRKKITSLVTENERLDKLFVSLKKVDVPPVENVKQRMSQEDAVKLRKANAELEAKLNSVTEEARRQAHQYTEYIKENDARWESERSEWTKRAEGLGKDAPPQIPQPSILLPSAFSLPCGSVMVCPVPIRTGRLVPLIEVYQSWVRYPADNEGTFFTSFLCPYTTQLSSLASAEEVILLHNIAAELRLFVMPPLRFQHFLNGNWIDFSFVDQITIAAMCCKHYRLGTSRVVENVMVCHGDFIFKIHISDNVVDFQMQPVHNVTKTSPACLLEGVNGFFQRWTFPTGDDGSSGGD